MSKFNVKYRKIQDGKWSDGETQVEAGTIQGAVDVIECIVEEAPGVRIYAVEVSLIEDESVDFVEEVSDNDTEGETDD